VPSKSRHSAVRPATSAIRAGSSGVFISHPFPAR
jgi:hypothetical protein